MTRAIWLSAVLSLVATWAMFRAPTGQADPVGTVLRTFALTALFALLGRLVGSAKNRRPPSPQADRVVITILATVAVQVAAAWLAPGPLWVAAVWYLALFAAGVLFNRWCEAPARYAVLAAIFIVCATSVILMALSAARPLEEGELTSTALLRALWPNVTGIAAHPADAAWMWLAWRVTDRLRPKEARKIKSIWRIPSRRPQPKRSSVRKAAKPPRSKA
jgi:hypothetical protein